jgi:hypothetical protein
MRTFGGHEIDAQASRACEPFLDEPAPDPLPAARASHGDERRVCLDHSVALNLRKAHDLAVLDRLTDPTVGGVRIVALTRPQRAARLIR